MRIDVVTLFPEIFAGFNTVSFVGKAQASGQLTLAYRALREHGLGRHRNVDDTPYGGGSGMVMRVDVLVACLEAIDADPARNAPKPRRVLLTPQGAPWRQADATRLARAAGPLVLICGRYEGFDERLRSHVDEEVSLGDFVMTGGEVAAMAMIESIVRLLPGVLGNADSIVEESHGESGLLEYPQYTRPQEFRGAPVPDVLAGGNHAEIAKYRRAAAAARTQVRRPDLWTAAETKEKSRP
jgi:tRNA (guanine37-N1)-methyltransferase